MARAAVTLCLSAIVASTPVAAQEPLIDVDGCGILAALVYTEVTKSGLKRVIGPGSALMFPDRDDLTVIHLSVDERALYVAEKENDG